MKVLEGLELKRAKGSTIMFFSAIILVVIVGMFPSLRPTYEVMVKGAVQTGQITMGNTIIILCLPRQD
jgi:anaerobic C4-dicarboxylate transporter